MFKNEMYVTNTDVSASVYNTSISIPSSTGITQKQLQTVVETIKTFFKG